jgi:SAM-dependent methyltransferase
MSQYQSYSQWKDWSLNFSYSEFEQRYYEKELGGIVAPGRRIIEIGFGNGGFLAWAKQVGAEVYGVEIQPEILAAAHEHGFVAVDHIDQLLPYRKDGFDAAIALDVFEHIPTDDIPSTLNSIETLLKPGGTLTIRVPNGLSPFGRYNQYGDTTHINVVTPAKLAQWSFATHLRIDDVRNEARVPNNNRFRHRLGKRLQFTIREWLNKVMAKIYGLPISTLDPNLVIVLKNTK